MKQEKEVIKKNNIDLISKIQELSQTIENLPIRARIQYGLMGSQITPKAFNELFKSVTGGTAKMGPGYTLTLDLNISRHLSLLEYLSKIKLPNCNYIRIHNIPKDNAFVKEFLERSLPNCVNQIWLNESNPEAIDAEFYFKSICKATKSAKHNFFLCNFELNSHQVVKYLASTKHCNCLVGFVSCNLKTSTVPDFKNYLDGAQFKNIGLTNCGQSDRSDWSSNFKNFENFIEGLSQSSYIKNNLKSLHLTSCGMEVTAVRACLDANGLKNVQTLGA